MGKNRGNDDLNQIGEKLLVARKAAGLSQKKLAEIADVDYNTISNIEKGSSYPSAQTMISISEALCISPSYLFPERFINIDEVQVLTILASLPKKERDIAVQAILAMLNGFVMRQNTE